MSLFSSINEKYGENFMGEESYRTPKPSTPDTMVTSTLSCVAKDEMIIKGGFQMTSPQAVLHITFALIKPDGMEYLEEIERKMREEGFCIIRSRTLRMSPEEVSNFYYDHYGEPYFPLLVMNMCEGPVKVYVLHRKDAVAMWKLMCGPTSVEIAQKKYPDSLRGLYGTPGNSYRNVCHAPRSEEKAREEIKFFFPEMKLEENYQNSADVESYLKEFVNPTLLEGLIALCKNKPLDPLQWLGEWLLMNNPNKPKLLREIAITPT